MKRITAIFLLAVTLAGCGVAIDVDAPDRGNAPAVRREYPTVNLPRSLRQENWPDSNNEGSCVHATIVNLFRWQGRPNMANYWRHTYEGPEAADWEWDPDDNLADKLTREGVRFAYTTKGDVGFLEWACNTRRGCGVTVMGGLHMVALVHFDEEWAGILDSNDPSEIIWVPRASFVSEWQNSNGWAVTPVYTPAPPLPS